MEMTFLIWWLFVEKESVHFFTPKINISRDDDDDLDTFLSLQLDYLAEHETSLR